MGSLDSSDIGIGYRAGWVPSRKSGREGFWFKVSGYPIAMLSISSSSSSFVLVLDLAVRGRLKGSSG
jgi:hypothetical protein